MQCLLLGWVLDWRGNTTKDTIPLTGKNGMPGAG